MHLETKLALPDVPRRDFDARRGFVVGNTNRELSQGAHMATGTVKWFNSVKGFGFIQPEDGTADVFVHISAVERAGIGNLHEGQKLSYEVERDPRKGKSSAVNLRAL